MDSTAVKRSPSKNIIGSSVFPGQNVLLGVQWHVPMQTEPFIPEKAPKLEEKAESAMMPPPASVPPVRRNEVKLEAESPTSCLPPGFQEFVSTAEAPLPSLSVENYLSRIESPPQVHHPSKAADLIPLPLGQLELPTQQSLNSPGQVIIPPKIPGLLGESGDPLLTGTELIFPTTEDVSTAVAPTLLENPISGQEFVSVQADSGFRVGGEVVAGGLVFSPERLAAPPSQHTSPMSLSPSSPLSQTTSSPLSLSTSSLSLSTSSPLSLATSSPVPLTPSQAFPGLLPESALHTFSPPKETKPSDLISSMPKEVSSIAEVSKPVHPIPQKKCEEGIPLPQELTQMSEHDLLSYINPSCFDQV